MKSYFTRTICVITSLIFVFLCFASCGKTQVSSTSSTTAPAAQTAEGKNDEAAAQEKIESDDTQSGNDEGNTSTGSEHPLVEFTMENGGHFIIELYPEYAPKTVENFLKLVNSGFYDGLTFHRVVDGFMAQGGSSDGNGYEGSGEYVYGEFKLNGVDNPLSHTRGVVSMARSSAYNSASSQFFICYGDATFLDGQYAAFGKVIDGMETVDAFLEIERTMGADKAISKPVTPIVIEKAVQMGK